MKIGIYGGTFNPIHLGHLRTAEEIRQRFGLREIIFVPSAQPPHKVSPDIVDGSHRLKMVALAITGNPAFSVSDLEVRRGGKSYSLETLRELKPLHPESDLAFILGLDAFLEINTWHQWEQLFAEAEFIVTSRPGTPRVAPTKAIPEAVRKEFRHAKGAGALGGAGARSAELPSARALRAEGTAESLTRATFVHTSGKTLTFTEVTGLDISSKKLRQMVRDSVSPRYLIPRRVGEYIAEHQLYQK
ncbi:MAG: nicotinate (nicotinamide) nucleotide adenylyltransferase [Deltaproteobacteria bacterium RBG_13_61_14]|nr:MAG: nicotinate (nicotinamide) nucleotide adenylyltransferase [Deltaproteobacteria bacterium RBG_13_61_14]